MIKNFRVFLLFFTLLLVTNSYAQYQFPDPGFEDWSGAQFANSIQPHDWRFSNVSQLGVDKNFAHRDNGRSGYCLLIQDQFVGVGSIGATSPGYVALGQPWAYVSSLTSINDATAGTYGGIPWTHRPDSVTVWIKRMYDGSVDQAAGDHTADENFNIVYYAWSGTAQGGQYKAKNGSCTDISSSRPEYCIDEESDVRQALNGNECGTLVQCVQVAEGWYREKAAYQNWTKITVPIYYLSDNAPQKCNFILSAGNYPNFRANNGIYAGNSLWVDDVELIYSSKIQKLYINNREWRGFDPDNTTTEQVFSLGQGVTTIPDIYAVRGAGSLTNLKGNTAAFPGRRLNAQECVIQNGAVDGAATVITVHSEDGSSTSTYRIRFVSQASNNAKLADIRVNGQTINGFNAYLNNYNVALPYGTTSVPQVAADPQDAGANVQITQPTSVNGTSVITVTAQDGSTVQTYTLNFSVAQLSDVTLQDILVDGASVPGFSPTKSNYVISLPLGTTAAPQVEPVSAYPAGEQTITIVKNNLTEGCQIQVSAPGAVAAKTYKITYRIEASQYSYLQSLMVDGQVVESFDPESFVYYVNLPLGTTQLPEITWTQGDRYQTVALDQSDIHDMEGTATVTVTAASGAQSVYRVVIAIEKSVINSLEAIFLNGEALEGFDPNTLSYQVSLPIGTTAAPAITWTLGDEYQTVSLTPGGLTGTSRIFVTAQNGATRIYQITFSVATSSDATLSMIYLDGEPLEGFSPDEKEYSVSLPQGTTQLPAVTYQAHDQYQTISTRPASSLNGDYKIIVKPQTGAAQTYTIHFSVASSQNTALAGISVGGRPLEGFDPEILSYTDTLPLGVTSIPAVTYAKAEASQRVQVQISGTTATLTVTAGGGQRRTYTVEFVILKSENAFLKLIRLDQDTLPGFDPEVLNYVVSLPDSVLAAPVITVEKNEGQRVLIAQPSRIGTASITVTPEQGSPNIYRIHFVAEGDTSSIVTPIDPQPEEPQPQSEEGKLAAIMLDGVLLNGFQPGVYSYQHIVRASGAQLPAISYTKGEEHQVVVMGQTAADVVTLTVMAEAGNLTNYTLSFDYQPDTDATLHSLLLNGEPLTGFSPSQTYYNLNLPAGAASLPALSFTMANHAIALVVTSDNEQTVDVWAEDGISHTQYTVHYTLPLSNDATLAQITLDGEPLAGFSSDNYNYEVAVPWHATVLPEINVQTSASVESVVVTYATIGEASTIRVIAEDGLTMNTYSIVFSSPLSADATLLDLQVDGAELNFDPAQHNYTVQLPYGTAEVPAIQVEKALQEQQVVITRRSLQEPATVEVTAEDGSKLTYTINFEVAQSQAANVLTAIIVDGFGALDMNNGPDFEVELPYGTSTLDIVSISKSFPEQQVLIERGGVHRPTVIRVFSGREGETEKRYTITPVLPAHDPAYLTDLQVDGVSVPGFDPSVYEYVVVAGSNAPVVTYTASAGSDAYDVLTTVKQCKIDVENGAYLHTYTVSFYYPQDLTFDLDFESWTDYTNTDANKSGAFPNGWYSAINAVTSGSRGSYEPQYSSVASAEATSGSQAAGLNTVYLLTSAEAMPGFLSLSEPTVVVGYWGLGLINSSSTLSYGEPIPFRNSPDSVALDYRLDAANRVTGWRFEYKANGQNKVDYAGAFANLGAWQTLSRPIFWGEDEVPASLDILISAAPTDSLGAYYIGINGAQTRNRYTSSMIVDNLRLIYSSRLAGATVNGVAAQIAGTQIAAVVPSESWGVPTLGLVGDVADQGRQITWQPEVNGVRTATVRNIAEDGSFTDYQLTVTRPLSTIDTCSYVLTGRDLTVTPGSAHQTLAISLSDSVYTIVCTAEAGNSQTYTVRFLEPSAVLKDTLAAVPYVHSAQGNHVILTPVKEPSSDAHLTGILVNGQPIADFSSLVTDYTVAPVPGLRIDPIIAEGAQVSISRTDGRSRAINGNINITVVSEDLSAQNVYTLSLVEQPSHESDLAAIKADEQLLAGFSPDQYTYSIVLPSAEPKLAQPQMPDLAYLTADSLQQVTVELAPLGATTYLTVTAADGNTQSVYEILFTASRSSYAYLAGISVGGQPVEGFAPEQMNYSLQVQSVSEAVSYTKGDAFQTVTEERTGFINGQDVVTLTVTAEDGTVAQYTITLIAPAASSDASVIAITLDGELLDGFLPSIHEYEITLPKGASLPDMRVVLSDPNATAAMSLSGDTAVITATAEDGVTTEQYTLIYLVERSSEARLQMILLDDEELEGFSPDVYSYNVDIPVGSQKPDIDWVKMQPEQRVTLTESGLTSILNVTAEDGTPAQYQIIFNQLLSEVDTLQMIYEDGLDLPGFSGHIFQYEFELPVGSLAFPELSYEPGDQWQTVLTDTLQNDDMHLTIRFNATSQSGNTKHYTVAYTILQSEVDTLQAIWLNNQPLDGFSGIVNDYQITLPYGTTELPSVDYIKGDQWQTVDTTWVGQTLRIHVVAQSGAERTYTIAFTIARSSNAFLQSIDLDGAQITGFYDRLFSYTVSVPYGTTSFPEVSWIKGDEQQVVDTVWTDTKLTINVTAGDGTTTSAYEVLFSILPSTNASLLMLFLDGEPLADFAPDSYQYTDTLPYGTEVFPTITWTTADDQQTVTVAQQGNEAVVTVVAGDGATSEEYTITYVLLLSPNNYLADLQTRGQTVDGFCRDSVLYHLVYPVGTDESELLTAADVAATAEDPEAVVVISDEADHSITIMVTAPNGDVRVYVITQEILLADEARLKMIWLDGEELSEFDSDLLEYVIILSPGANMPDVTAEPLDEHAEVEYGSFEDILGEDYEGKSIEIDGVAENGNRITYRVIFRYANWSATADADKDDYLFVHVPGSHQYKAVSISIGLSVAIYDENGQLLMMEEVPVVDPNDATVEVTSYGNQRLISVEPDADGVIFEVPVMNTPYFYVFFDTKQNRVAKGGKFMLVE